MKEALLYETLTDKCVQCQLCAHRCTIAEGKSGLCHVRENRAGTLYTLVYGNVIARHADPVEKKPLSHFYPGSSIYSVATPGCNFRCKWCQNWEISQMPRERNLIPDTKMSPEETVEAAKGLDCAGIAYTYTEPTIFFEYAYETAKLARDRGLKNVFVTNGYMTDEALRMVSPSLDAANVDLKAFTDTFYKKQCGAKLEPVKNTLRLMKQLGILVEVTTLLIPGLNDDENELKALAGFVVNELGAETPWHISRFHPTYRLIDRPPTPLKTLKQAARIGRQAGLRYVYLGNVPGEDYENTYCHNCGELLIRRYGFHIDQNRIRDDGCPQCRTPVYGIGMSG